MATASQGHIPDLSASLKDKNHCSPLSDLWNLPNVTSNHHLSSSKRDVSSSAPKTEPLTIPAPPDHSKVATTGPWTSSGTLSYENSVSGIGTASSPVSSGASSGSTSGSMSTPGSGSGTPQSLPQAPPGSIPPLAQGLAPSASPPYLTASGLPATVGSSVGPAVGSIGQYGQGIWGPRSGTYSGKALLFGNFFGKQWDSTAPVASASSVPPSLHTIPPAPLNGSVTAPLSAQIGSQVPQSTATAAAVSAATASSSGQSRFGHQQKRSFSGPMTSVGQISQLNQIPQLGQLPQVSPGAPATQPPPGLSAPPGLHVNHPVLASSVGGQGVQHAQQHGHTHSQHGSHVPHVNPAAQAAASNVNVVRPPKKNGRPSTNTELYKTELCASYMSTGGNCPYGEKCQFAHGEHELKIVDRPPKWRSKPCQNWVKTGTCSYNERCCFRHDIPVNQGQ